MSEHTLPTWITDHLQRYLASNGADGHLWDATAAGGHKDTPTLLLTTIGRKSGRTLVLPLIYTPAGKDFVIVASKGGAAQHPAWYLNLQAQPVVDVQVAARKFRARARTATGAERADLWQKAVDNFPPYATYQTRTDREIPVVVLEALQD